MNKVLSIIVPAYNVETYLADGLRSLVVADRTVFDVLEVIVVNDGSVDRTSEIAHGFASEFPYVFKVIDKANENYGSCINAGLNIACGMYVRILDGDDSYDTSAFERYMRFVINETRSTTPCDVIFNDFKTVDAQGKILEYKSYDFIGRKGATLADFDYEEERVLWAPAISYRLELLHRIGYEQTEGIFYTDQEWDAIPMMDVESFTYCPEAIYNYLIGRSDQSCNDAVRLRNFAMHFPVAEKIIQRYKMKGPIKGEADANMRCVEAQIRSHIRAFYWTCLIRHPDVLLLEALKEFDEFLKCNAIEFFKYAAGLEVLRWPLSFCYVREWRRRNTRRTMKFFFFETYIKLRTYLARWKCGICMIKGN